jgi:phage terminase small subunit
MNKLTPKQEKFARNIVSGMNETDAYKNAYNVERMSDTATSVEASRLYNHPKVAQKITELSNKLDNKTIMTAEERLKYLESIIKGIEKEKDKVVTPSGQVVEIEKDTSVKTKMEALNLMNKMTGEYIQKIQADVNADVDINIELTDEE